jgi:hypothetical protein
MNARVVMIAVAAVLIAVGGWFYYRQHVREVAAPAAPVETPAPAAPEETAPEVRYPVEPPTGSEGTGIPELDDSDGAMIDALTGVFGEPARELFVPDLLVRRIVATVDGLGQKKLAVRNRPVRGTSGSFVTEGEGEALVIAPDNYARYTPYVQLIANADAAQLADLYLRYYPRFQQAYEQLGYPTGYFNDRLVDVIDDLLETPEVDGPIALVRPRVQYEFADPDLEARSAGQKLLLRMGPENANLIKSKLRQLRIEVTSRAPQR